MMVCLRVHGSMQVCTWIVLVYCVQACICILVYIHIGQVSVCMFVFVCSEKSII